MLNEICTLAKECGNLIKQAHAGNIQIKSDNPKNLVTEYDTRVQEILRQKLLKILPEADFLGEEGQKNFNRDGYCFICDPIDGTTNFVKNLKHSGVSIALLHDGRPVLGVIYNPYLDELFWAEKGKGAYCNGIQIHTSGEPLQNSLIVFGTSPYNADLQARTWQLAAKSLDIALDVRRQGAAVLDLTDVACGRFGMFWELELQPWDYAAGALIVEEAGGIVKTLEGEPVTDYFAPTSLAAMANTSAEIFFK